jgi:hypothetical protein
VTSDHQPEIEPVNGQEILEKLARLPISSWSYRWEDPAKIRHLGPMSQDFMAAFGLGDNDRQIAFIDANGVVMVAIQALYRRIETLESELAVRTTKGETS